MTSRSKAVLWVLAVFLVGALCGGALVYVFAVPNPLVSRLPRRPPSSVTGEAAVKRLADDLGLDAGQRAQAHRIFEAGHKQFEALFAEQRKKSHVIREETRRQLREILRPDQLKKFDEFVRRHDQRPARRRDGPRP